MSLKKFASATPLVAAAAFAIFAGSAGFAPAIAEAGVCKSAKTSALGNWSRTFWGARFSARLAWKAEAYRKYGSQYDTWLRSANKSYGCWSHNGRERCRATARACRA